MDLNSITDPVDGMMVEVFPGVFYVYSERENSWVRINGFESIKPATAIESGLMTKEDFIKVDTLLTAQPITTLTSDQCDAVFDGGVIGFYSRNHSLFVEDYLDLYEEGSTRREQWHVHEDTWGFNFRVNLQYLVEEMKKRGNLISETIVGPKGPSGDRGDPGINKLDTGPKGEAGDAGTNAPFGGSLTNTSGLVLRDKSKAVVNVTTELVSPEENYLVVHKGVISPEKLCTRQVSVENTQSTWVLVRNQKGIVCTDGCVTEFSCEDQTAFTDVEVVVNSIKEHTEALILEAKKNKEDRAREWLRTMMKVFNDQKYALCCGLENCRSRKRNQDERRYIESQRIAAAAADFNLIISGSRDGEDVPEPHTKVELDMDQFKSCEGPGWQPTIVTPVNPPVPPQIALLIFVFVDEATTAYTLSNIDGSGKGQYLDNDFSNYQAAVAGYTAGPVVTVVCNPSKSKINAMYIAPANFSGHSSLYMKDSNGLGTIVGRPPSLQELKNLYSTVTGGLTPVRIGLIVDESGSMIKNDIQPGYRQFKKYLETLAPTSEKSIETERWLEWSAKFINGVF